MPVLECSCGMVMSISLTKPRNTCIRCGGVEFRELERFNSAVTAMHDLSFGPITNCGSVLPCNHSQQLAMRAVQQSSVVLDKSAYSFGDWGIC